MFGRKKPKPVGWRELQFILECIADDIRENTNPLYTNEEINVQDVIDWLIEKRWEESKK